MASSERPTDAGRVFLKPAARLSSSGRCFMPAAKAGSMGAAALTYRLLALLVALSACVGIGLEFATLMSGGKSVLSSAWVLIGYFTILTNGLAAIVFGAIGLQGERFDHPRLVAGMTALMT